MAAESYMGDERILPDRLGSASVRVDEQGFRVLS